MSDVTQILARIDSGDPAAAERLLPLVYDELRRLAAHKLAHEAPGNTLQATALVHEAYLRLVDVTSQQPWDGRGHFFAAAAEAMRRILVENARRKKRVKHGGELMRLNLDESEFAANLPPDDLLLLNDAIDALAAHDQEAAELVKLRYFVGLSVEDAADSLKLSRTSAYRHWTYARAWLIAQLQRPQ
jgi:RNA polymerase sigma factor (TIGR02999 family)